MYNLVYFFKLFTKQGLSLTFTLYSHYSLLFRNVHINSILTPWSMYLGKTLPNNMAATTLVLPKNKKVKTVSLWLNWYSIGKSFWVCYFAKVITKVWRDSRISTKINYLYTTYLNTRAKRTRHWIFTYIRSIFFFSFPNDSMFTFTLAALYKLDWTRL